jgi:alpha-galactosidase
MQFLFVVVACVLVVVTRAYDNGVLSDSPPMGWSTWCTEDLCGLLDICTEREIKKRADAMVEQGMVELGYNWIFLDDCWAAKERDSEGRLQGEPKQFPHGMKALADYIHDKGLYLSLYTCIGTKTCKKNRPGSYGNYETDANTFAEWGIDMVKCDNCNNPAKNETQALFTEFSQALNSTGHEMLFALCEWGEDDVWKWGPDISQMYRVQMDHLPFFDLPTKAAGAGYGQGTSQIIEWMANIRPATFAGRAAWADPDFLMTMFDVLIDTMPYTESRTEFTFWALWSSPLLVATDVVDLSQEKRDILMNKEVLAVYHDPLYISGDRFVVDESTGTQAWQRPLSNGDIAVVIYNADKNRDKEDKVVEFTFQQLRDAGLQCDDTMNIRDLWQGEDLGAFTEKFSQILGPHASQMYRLSKK